MSGEYRGGWVKGVVVFRGGGYDVIMASCLN